MIDSSRAYGPPRWSERVTAPSGSQPTLTTAAPPAPFAISRRFARGALIIEAESPARTVYLVRSGQVRTFLLREDGQETTTALLGPGQLFGIAPLLGRRTYHAFVEALTEVEAWALPADQLLDYLVGDPALLQSVLGALSQRLTLAQALLKNATLLPVAERIPDALARLDGCLGGERAELTRERLAGLVGARRETISRAVTAARAGSG